MGVVLPWTFATGAIGTALLLRPNCGSAFATPVLASDGISFTSPSWSARTSVTATWHGTPVTAFGLEVAAVENTHQWLVNTNLLE
jgi:hypothetical protein